MRLILIEKRQETADTKSFFLKPESQLLWKAGQYIHYKLPHDQADDRGIERYFSISSAPFENIVRLTTRFAQKSSSFKNALNALRIDGAIEADPPEGDFIVDRVDKPLVFIAGGIGITPFRAILLDLEKRDEPLNIQLLYANSAEDVPFRAELEDLSRRQPSFKIKYFIGKNRLDASGLRQLAPNLNEFRFYISGPEPMVESFDKTLKELSVSGSNIQNDFFPGYEWP